MDCQVFKSDDFFEIAARVLEAVENPINLVAADIGNVTVPEFEFSPQDDSVDLVEYSNSNAGNGPKARKGIARHLSKHRAFTDLHQDNITLAPSITSASINVIFALKRLSIQRIGLVAPCYYATKLQCERIGLPVKLLPLYFGGSSEDIFWEDEHLDSDALWITHPVISTTRDFNLTLLGKWVAHRRNKGVSYLIIDEAVDCKPPSQINLGPHIEVIRLRSFFKQLSVNGQRCAFVVSSKAISETMSQEVWLSHGGLDQFSLSTLDWALENEPEYEELQRSMLAHCKREQEQISKLIMHSNLSVPEYENGYITSIRIDMSGWASFRSDGHFAARAELIDFLVAEGVVPTLSPSMYFAHEDGTERLRIGLLGNVAIRDQVLLRLIDYSAARENTPIKPNSFL